MEVVKFVEFAHSQMNEINQSLRVFSENILDRNMKLCDTGFWNENGDYIQKLEWVEYDRE